jgi:hypothetical protein
MTITICDMQFEDTKAQCVLWQKLNKVMFMKGVPNLKLKGFMVDNTEVNWNTIRIMYGNRDPSELMVEREQTCYFHWTQSMDRHTKQQIKPKMWKQCTTTKGVPIH